MPLPAHFLPLASTNGSRIFFKDSAGATSNEWSVGLDGLVAILQAWARSCGAIPVIPATYDGATHQVILSPRFLVLPLCAFRYSCSRVDRRLLEGRGCCIRCVVEASLQLRDQNLDVYPAGNLRLMIHVEQPRSPLSYSTVPTSPSTPDGQSPCVRLPTGMVYCRCNRVVSSCGAVRASRIAGRARPVVT